MGLGSQIGRKSLYILGAVVVAAAVIVCAVAFAASGPKVRGGTPQERIASIQAITDSQADGAADAIAEAVNDPDSSVRRVALVCLGRFCRPQDRALVEKCLSDKDPAVRGGAAVALGRYSDTASADKLGELIAREENEDVRAAAVSGLAQNQTDKAVVVLLESAEKNMGHDTFQRRAMSALLGKLDAELDMKMERNAANWLYLFDVVKGMPKLQEAYKRVGVPVIQHPEHRPPPLDW